MTALRWPMIGVAALTASAIWAVVAFLGLAPPWPVGACVVGLVAAVELVTQSVRHRHPASESEDAPTPSSDLPAPAWDAPTPAGSDQPMPTPPDRASTPPPPLDLTAFVAGRQAREPQCPRCGRFDLAVEPGDPFRLQCRACGQAWTWRPGTAWPRTSPEPGHPPPEGHPAPSRSETP
ncbi:MAG: hypothetical protein GY929_02735 [Actinomycetia bacterium]|nr:hypothetical protein [Actinomycetes bacterium]